MSWEGGMDLVACTQPGLTQPNVILHLGRIVHTPKGSAPSGMIVWQPQTDAAPWFLDLFVPMTKWASISDPIFSPALPLKTPRS